MIKNFSLIYDDPGYDIVENPENRSVYQLSPIGSEWYSTNTQKKVVFLFHDKGTALLLSTGCHVAVVTYGPSSYGAVLSEEGCLVKRFDISQSGEEFFDVYYVSKQLCFFKNIKGTDIRIEVSSEDFSIVRTVELKKY